MCLQYTRVRGYPAHVMSLNVDHVVLHIDDRPELLARLKADLAAIDVPFEPDWGKGTKGFKAANIWIGRQYFEIVRILRPDGGGWVPQWVARHREGQRGLYCLFLATDRLGAIADRLRDGGMPIQGPERITFRTLFGLIRKSMPWRVLYLPTVPGTGIEIGFIEYDPDPKDRMKAFMVPNADETGLSGVPDAALGLPMSSATRAFVDRVFPDAVHTKDGIEVPLRDGALRIFDAAEVQLDLFARRDDEAHRRGAVTLENVTLRV